MADFLTDSEILGLIDEQKHVATDFRTRLVPKAKRGHSEVDVDIKGQYGSEFRIIVRCANANPLDFSVILGYRNPESNQVLRLRRYNGKSHEHTNAIERETFYGFHMHTATERYQRTGNREDAYAEVTDRYDNLQGAINCLIEDCNVVFPEQPQMGLFDTGGIR
jgi:hypothetical protein